MVEKHGDGEVYKSRLSNGPMESVNRKAKELSLERIVQDYNVAIETIWHLQQQLLEEKQENAALWAAYEELSNKLYG